MTTPAIPSTLAALLNDHPEVERIEAFVVDVNGVSRGKWLPRAKAASLGTPGMPLPRSIFALDIWGRDVEAAGLAFGTGDPDGLCREIEGASSLVPWAGRPTAQVMVSMTSQNETFFAEPRGVLARLCGRLTDRGWRAVVAVELEFYLVEPVDGQPRPPGATGHGRPLDHGQVLGIDPLRWHERFFDDVEAACRMQNVPVDTMLRENGPGQYEVNLRHVADPLRAADHAVLLKRIVRHVARRHGMIATFMAKPYGDQSGNGMHVHCSLIDEGGQPLFADAGHARTPILDQAVAGLVETLPRSMLFLAPHANSYRRFRIHSHAPTHADWGIDDRAAAVRLIVGERAATRIELRAAGADANPYLVVAAMLAGMLHGIDAGSPLPPPGRQPTSVPLPLEWGAAIDGFARSAFAAEHFGGQFRDMFVACKRQDLDGMLARVSDVELQTCLDLI